MKSTKSFVVAAGLAAMLGSGPAFAQAASEEVKRGCRSTTEGLARMIEGAKRRGAKDLEQGIRKPSDSWGSQVATYMIQAANRSDSLSETELASLGYAYCAERRPRN